MGFADVEILVEERHLSVQWSLITKHCHYIALNMQSPLVSAFTIILPRYIHDDHKATQGCSDPF